MQRAFLRPDHGLKGTLQRSTCSSSQPARSALRLPASRTQRGAVGICHSSGSKRDPPHSEQHGERAVRTPFSPLGFMPVLPDAPEQQQQQQQTAAPTATATDTPHDASSTAAAAVELYPGVAAGTPWCVTLVFPERICPERLVFVVHQLESDAWVRDHGANFSLQLRSPCLGDLVEGVLAAEGGYEHWGLLHRLQRVLELLDNAEAAGAAGMSFMFTWLRLSSNRLLDWQRCFSYQPRDITWAQQQVAERITEKARSSSDPAVRMYARMTLGKLSRGGGNGDEIRMGILNIMRDHGIKEGNRGGLDEPFLEQWHQKLHQATSPEDVIIAEAYLAFLHSANHEDWWRVLAEKGLSKEQIESWEQPITALPMHLPQLIPPISHYHWVLKTCHSGAELDTALTCAQGFVDPDLRWHLHDLLGNRNAWWAPGKTLELRRRLKPYCEAPGSSRDLLLLDIALESWLRLLVERQDKRALSGDDLVELMGLVLGNAALTGTSAELELVSAQWEAVRTCPDRWSRAWCLAASAALGRVTLALSAFADEICSLVQPYAELFGLRCGIPAAFTLNFSEEVVRDQALFVGSLLAAELEPRLRTAAGASSWQVVSQVQVATGKVVLLPDLLGVQGVAFDQPTVVLAQALGGMEDIPDGVVAVLTRSSTDVLSHVAIRARTQGVLLAGCSDEEEWRHLVELEGQQMSLSVASSGDVIAAPPDSTAAAASAAAPSTDASSSNGSEAPSGSAAGGAAAAYQLAGACWREQAAQMGPAFLRVLQEHEFQSDVVGAKACNLAKLRKRLPEWILVPRSVALPFGTFETVLADPVNADVAQQLAAIDAQLAGIAGSKAKGSAAAAAAANGGSNGAAAGVDGGAVSAVALLARARELVENQLKPPAGMQQLVHQGLCKAGLLQGDAGSSSSSIQSMDSALTTLPTNGTSPSSSSDISSNGRDQHQQQLALPIHVESGPAWDVADPACPAWTACWSAICGVWASKWNHRAWLSRRSAGLPEEQLAVSVLMQQVLPGEYAFVLHTASPFSGARGEMYGEMVCGLGETLVGNHPGRPLAFSDKPDGSEMQLLALPSKRQGLFVPAGGTLIARSDTNGEDLAGYAGAGLYDSIPVTPLEPRFPNYATEPLMWDAAFRQQLLDGLVELGYAVESAFNDTPQDIEGVWLGGRFAVVQSRPQVMAACSGSGNGSSGAAASSAGRQRAKALAAAEAAEAAAAVAAVREAGPGPGVGGGSGEWEW
ncbi:hypothetical protein OEZ85_000786 [Tetradesmus obliquus]|uniref:Pyruvate phosphate dikinase AMP/ATP-binding domain-containing protein n=1 Tax=Tetradesmus obliquus TaxID=3088 RepID=A0ABY8UJ85_TETOB|nr:hypothetical protein OEZ85_000786 [Tetradesmus obliquus]